jgi:hypothetical protein
MPSLDINFLHLLKDNFKKYPIFIETGTYNGDTIFSVEPYFDMLYTIELSQKYFNNTKSKYKGKKINFILGDSSFVFESFLPNIDRDSIFFLDGHWSSADTAKGNKDCPLIEEIQHINNLYKNKAIIIIDDFRLFEKGPKTGSNEDWTDITKEKICSILSSRITDIYHLDSTYAKNDRLIIQINSKEI